MTIVATGAFRAAVKLHALPWRASPRKRGSTLFSRAGALTIDDRGGWAGFTALALARGDVERVVDALQRSVPIPQHEVRMRRALRGQVLGQRLPLATRREHVEDCVEHLANIHLAPTAAALGWRDHRLNQRPFGIRQVTRISQTTPLSSAAMFRFPHLGTPQSTIRVPHNESQMIHPTQQLSGSALSNGAKSDVVVRN